MKRIRSDRYSCRECSTRHASLAFNKVDLDVLAHKLYTCKESRRPSYLKQVAEAKARIAQARDELQRHQSECPIYNGIEDTVVEEPPTRSFTEMQKVFLPPYPQSHPEDGEYF